MIIVLTLIEEIINRALRDTITTRRTITITLLRESSTIEGRLNVFLLLDHKLGGKGLKGIFHVMRIDTRMRGREWEGGPITKVPLATMIIDGNILANIMMTETLTIIQIEETPNITGGNLKGTITIRELNIAKSNSLI